MNDLSEKRTFNRHNKEAHIICALFNTDKYHQGKIRNYGEGGLYFESAFAFQPRTCIYIRFNGLTPIASSSPLQHGFRTTTLAEVKWCKEISDTKSYRYGIGVRYYEPY